MTRARAPFPWDEVLGLCLNRLRWPPESFWRATPRELAAALTGLAGASAPTRADLSALMQAHPDVAGAAQPR
ncbi:MAG: phage tail assembly chaperone [Salinarimonas sp.]|nr:phage tail assembly chaperone [Salinarimonas sp.]